MALKDLAKFLETCSKEQLEEAAKKAAEGFEERLREREKRYAKEGLKWEPSASWYDRSYDI